MTEEQKVCIVGLGYIGLPTAALVANKGFQTLGVDIQPSVVAGLNQGKIHIFEPDLDKLVSTAVASKRLRASTRVEPADIFIIAVPTPFKEGKQPDLTYVRSALASIAPFVQTGNLVILESTSPVGTTELLCQWLKELRPELSDVLFAYCPERVLPGQIIKELVENDRIVGGLTPDATRSAAEFYGRFVKGGVLLTNSRTAELCKLAENSFRDVNIAFANELSLICGRLGIDVWELIRLANRHPRVNILQPGPGVGGHCIAVDPWFIVASSPDESRLIRTAREVNDSKPHYVAKQVKDALVASRSKTVACLGLAFKADIDDLRESPAVEIAAELAHDPMVKVLAVEPHVRTLPQALQGKPNIELVSLETALEKSEVVALLVSHKAFRALPIGRLENKRIVDTRGLWSQV